jgi:hypothetical protein
MKRRPLQLFRGALFRTMLLRPHGVPTPEGLGAAYALLRRAQFSVFLFFFFAWR